MCRWSWNKNNTSYKSPNKCPKNERWNANGAFTAALHVFINGYLGNLNKKYINLHSPAVAWFFSGTKTRPRHITLYVVRKLLLSYTFKQFQRNIFFYFSGHESTNVKVLSHLYFSLFGLDRFLLFSFRADIALIFYFFTKKPRRVNIKT